MNYAIAAEPERSVVDHLDQLWYSWAGMARVVVNVSEAKAKLSKLIDMVYHGETVTIAKNNLPVVDLVPHSPRGRRRLGIARGKITISEDFDAETDELNELFYGGEHEDPA